jgi:peptidoglycan-associated lipoprotein
MHLIEVQADRKNADFHSSEQASARLSRDLLDIEDLDGTPLAYQMTLPQLEKEDGMRKAPEIVLMGMLVVTSLLAQACGTFSGSGAGDEDLALDERINEPAMKYIPPKDFEVTSSLTRPSMRAELSARNATGLPKGSLIDVLFDFDRATLRADALPVLDANAKRLQKDGVTRLLLEGRGDEIGTAAYNIVLGDRRARNVRSYLQDLGLSVDLKTTSCGKDRPLCFRHNEDCMQRNRSVHFVVKE